MNADRKNTILIVDDEKNIRQSIAMVLDQENYHVIQAHDWMSAIRFVQEKVIDLLILDIKLGEVDGLTLFKKIQQMGYEIPTLFISGHASLSEAAQAVKIGGYDFIEKPFNSDKLIIVVQRCLAHFKMNTKIQILMKNKNWKDEIIGESPLIKQLLIKAEKVAQGSASVFVSGETGTGKELLSQFIHDKSMRVEEPFVKVNCSAIPENLIESELFGFEKGSFTGAMASKKGLFEIAHRGTLFLDEVADLSLNAQAKVLRFLQTGEIQKIGSEKSIKVDVRIISGTHKDLKKIIKDGLFREDLYYRLNVVPLQLPSLRERKEDIPLLIEFFNLKLSKKNNVKVKDIDIEVVEELKNYSWPGNIREIQNVVERMIVLSGNQITIADLPEDIQSLEMECLNTIESSMQPLRLRDFRDNAEKEFIINTLKKFNGNISKAAHELGVVRTYLHKRMKVLGIEKVLIIN